MNIDKPRLKFSWYWLLPLSALIALAAWEKQHARLLDEAPGARTSIQANAVTLSLLPEYDIAGGLDKRAETVRRTLFNPTRKPAAPFEPQKSVQLQRNQFTLTGTTIVGDTSVAFLKEVASQRSRVVKKGDQVDGMIVAEIRADRIKLSANGDAEEIIIKAPSANPNRAGLVPAVAAANPAFPGAVTGVPLPGGATSGPGQSAPFAAAPVGSPLAGAPPQMPPRPAFQPAPLPGVASPNTGSDATESTGEGASEDATPSGGG